MNPAPRYDFASDNTAPAMPEVMEALVRYNSGAMAAYGEDEVCAKAADLIRGLLDADAPVWFAASGTAANALCLATLTKPHEAVIAHRHAHVVMGETGAPGLFGAGLGLIGLPGASGRVDPTSLAEALARPDHPHDQAPAALSLTNATEYGCVYSPEQLKGLIAPAKRAGLGVHLDGARLANAVAAGFDPTALAGLGVDIIVLGGTKAGSTPTEAIVLLNRGLGRRFGARLKHAGQLVSKPRFLAAPWIGMLETHAWTTRAAHANAMAHRLAALMPFPLAHPVEANAVFVEIGDPAFVRLREAGWAVHRGDDGSARFMCAWSTTPELVDELGVALRVIV